MVKVPKIIKKIFFNQIWGIPNKENKVYLTFDDGPTPIVTEWVLEVLAKEKIKATFFCIGDNIRKNPAIFQKILYSGHTIGNHTYNHLKGWKTSTKKYLENIDKCQSEILNQHPNYSSKFFRPPYGKIKLHQSILLRKKGYKIIMWDVLSKDYNTEISDKKCFENTKKTVSGSIIVFHDSLKAENKLKNTLPQTIAFLKEKGFTFDTIN